MQEPENKMCPVAMSLSLQGVRSLIRPLATSSCGCSAFDNSQFRGWRRYQFQFIRERMLCLQKFSLLNSGHRLINRGRCK